MARTGTNDPVVIHTAKRRELVLGLRMSGATYRQIARTIAERVAERKIDIKLPKGWDSRYAYKDVKREMERLDRDRAEATDEVRRLELERLDKMLLAIWPQVRDGHLGAIDRALRISKRRGEISGLDKQQPTQNLNIDMSTLTTEQLERIANGDNPAKVLADTGTS